MIKVVDGVASEMTPEEITEYLNSTVDIGETSVLPAPQLYAVSQIRVSNGEVSSVDVSSRLSGVMRIDVGVYAIFFAEPMPDTSYLALGYNGGEYRCFVRSEEKFEDYLIMNAVDLAGIPADPSSISLEIKRIN